ncbi:MAG: SPOR domain-containing protein [Comamonadaceae bacterium]|nr:MAG: SPOR domain-containing protein [Comamonadaceae bacterium]
MAFFKFRWPGHKEQGDNSKPAKRSRNAQAESIDAMRRRARHRLIGAAVLVLIGIVGFPLLFDTQPRPIAVDIPIDIPDRNKVAPLVVPAAPATHVASASVAAPVRTPPVADGPVASASPGAGLDAGEEVISAKPAARASVPVLPIPPVPRVEPRSEARPDARQDPKPEPKPETKPVVPEPKPAVRTDDAARARALLEGRDSSPPASAAKAEDGRLIVQVGAFADADKARETRVKLERAGLKTYTQVVDTKDGKRTRVRVGPYANRAEADKAAAHIKGLGLSASVLAL